MATRGRDLETDFSFPRQMFPEYSYSPRESDAPPLGERSQRVEQRFNTVEYGRFSGLLEEGGGATYFRQNGRGKYVSYSTLCLPLQPPSTRTPYDDVVADTHNYPEEGMKHKVHTQVQYFHSNFRSVYVPLEDLCSGVESSNILHLHSMEFDSSHGSVVGFLPYQLPGCHGCIFYASGPGLQCLTIGLLLPRWEGGAGPASLPKESFSWHSRLHSPLHVEPVEALRLPGRILQVQASFTQGRAIVCVRCDYHVAFLEGPSCDNVLVVLNQYRSHLQKTPPIDPTFQPGLLQKIALFKTSVVASCVCLSPYIAGEGLVVMETGAVYQWSQDDGLTRLQSPLTTPNPSDRTHFWQCCYGPHPRSLVLAEQSGVSLGDFRTGGLSFRPLLAPPSEHLPSSAIVTALAPHPTHPFHLLVATSERLLLLDTRQPSPVLLALLHECPDPPRFLVPLHTSSGDTLLLLSSHHVPETVVYSYAGGSCRKGADRGVPAPHFTCLPHTTACYSDFGSQLGHIGPMYNVSYRLKQPLAGSCLVELGGGSYAAVVISTLGDLFFQCWRYEASPTPHPLPFFTPPTLRGYHIWLREAWEQEKQLLPHLEQGGGLGEEGLDFSPIMEYLHAATSVCLKCYTAASTFFSNTDTLIQDVIRDTDTSGNGMEPGQGSETGLGLPDLSARCSFCGQKKEPYYSRLVAMYRKRHNALPVSRGASGLQSLQEACVFTKPEEEEGLDRQLWEGWEEGREELGEGGRSVPSDVPALTTPSQITPATPTGSQPEGAGDRRTRAAKNTPSRTPRSMGF